jgi:hypothetical protein
MSSSLFRSTAEKFRPQTNETVAKWTTGSPAELENVIRWADFTFASIIDSPDLAR